MIHAVRLVFFTAMSFIVYSSYKAFQVEISAMLSNETVREIGIAFLVAIIIVTAYAIYENWERKEDDGDIRKGS